MEGRTIRLTKPKKAGKSRIFRISERLASMLGAMKAKAEAKTGLKEEGEHGYGNGSMNEKRTETELNAKVFPMGKALPGPSFQEPEKELQKGSRIRGLSFSITIPSDIFTRQNSIIKPKTSYSQRKIWGIGILKARRFTSTSKKAFTGKAHRTNSLLPLPRRSMKLESLSKRVLIMFVRLMEPIYSGKENK